MMKYYITSVRGNDRIIISEHNNKEEALKAGKEAFEKSKRDEVISCITGKVVNGKIEGQYRLVKSWF